MDHKQAQPGVYVGVKKYHAFLPWYEHKNDNNQRGERYPLSQNFITGFARKSHWSVFSWLGGLDRWTLGQLWPCQQTLKILEELPSVLWHCWLGGKKGIRPVRNMGGVVEVGTGKVGRSGAQLDGLCVYLC